MTPYETPVFFLWLLLPVLPAIILGLTGYSGRLRRYLILLSTAGIIYLTAGPTATLVEIAAFFLFQWHLVRGYLTYHLSAGKDDNRIYYAVVFAAILPLIAVKLNPLFHLQTLLNTPIGFLGISYLTFRTVGMILETRDGLIKQVNFLDFFCFVLFFPTFSSGPIDRYRRFLDDLGKPLSTGEYAAGLADGVEHVFTGFLYKFILAYLVNRYWLAPLTQTHGFTATVKYMYAYSAYLFFDFAGYTAFAVGVSYFLGIKSPENFNRPFLATNIKDFWNRWFMSLSFWLRDFVYMRFVLASGKKKRFKSRYTASYVAYFLTFLLMGIWHGIQTQYILYGTYHGVLMSGYDFLERKNRKPKDAQGRDYVCRGKGNFRDGLAILVTAHLVMFGFLIFSGRLTAGVPNAYKF
ncbi:MAG: D-alanyl-lipoteichoic acid biosynthesis protein DltB [Peptococcaceae bacterium]|jgi:membrane protein involved in D-alanine export|nr:D-alanyl-lipoteichoic acid biosynthesis protein DltB [Peptococcaceae bacterium]